MHPAKAFCSIVRSEDGSVTEVSDTQSMKALSAIVSTPSGMSSVTAEWPYIAFR